MRKTLSTKAVFSLFLILTLLITIIPQTGSTAYAAKKAKINKTKATMYVKQTMKLKVTGATRKVTWSSSNKKVAKVSSKGVVTALKKGTAKITAKTGKQKLTCKVTVKNPTISTTETGLYLNQTYKLYVSHAVGTVKWSSSDKSVVTVSSKGVIKGTGWGTATVTATASGVKLKCKVTVDTGTYYCMWNVNADLSPEGEGKTKLSQDQAAEVRNAINCLVDRTYVLDNIIKVPYTPAPSFVPKGIKEPDGSEFYQHAGPEGKGYYPVTSDTAAAVQTLKKYYKYTESNGETRFTDFPAMTFVYNTSGPVHKEVGEHFRDKLSAIGITLNLIGCSWDEYEAMLAEGNFTIARYGWVIDVQDPSNMLDLYMTESEENLVQLGRGNHKDAVYEVDFTGIGGKYVKISGNWKDTYDLLVGTYIKDEKDPVIRSQLQHKAEDLLMSTGAICPLYYYAE